MTKKELRVLIKRKRALLSTDQINDLSNQCFIQLLDTIQFKHKNIGLFLPIINSNEPNTFLLYKELIKAQANVFSPVTDISNLSINFYSLSSLSNLCTSRYGIPEPNNTDEKIAADLLDFLIVPLLAIDKQGYRVGYGKGLYDRFIPSCSNSLITIGINLFNEVFEIDDINSHDIALNQCVFPEGIREY